MKENKEEEEGKEDEEEEEEGEGGGDVFDLPQAQREWLTQIPSTGGLQHASSNHCHSSIRLRSAN